jgi:lipopolysaccharide export system permease protein
MEVITAVAFITLGFIGLFFFFDFVDELQWVRSSQPGGYQISHALIYVSLIVPSHLYELLPITVLIGSIYVLSKMAQTSEFTILRTSGLGPELALKSLLGIGLGFALLTFVVGDYVSPACDKYAQLLKSRFLGQITVGQTGAWLKEKQSYTNEAVNVEALTHDGEMSGVRIFEFDNQGRLISLTLAKHARFEEDGEAWLLSDVHRDEFTSSSQTANAEKGSKSPSSSAAGASGSLPKPLLGEQAISSLRSGEPLSNLTAQEIELLSPSKPAQRSHMQELRWPNSITQEMVSVALLKPDRMGTFDLFRYIQHLNLNSQSSQRYEIEFWKKVFYPISCLVMMVLALPFGYLHFRSGNITSFVFFGVMIGISFFLLNNVFGYIGNINQWAPWFAAAAPGMLYSLFSLSAFGWLVLRQ